MHLLVLTEPFQGALFPFQTSEWSFAIASRTMALEFFLFNFEENGALQTTVVASLC